MIWEMKTIEQNKLTEIINKIDGNLLADRLAYNLNMTRKQLNDYIDVDNIKTLIATLLINRELENNVDVLNRPQDYLLDPHDLYNADEASKTIYKYSQDKNATIYIYADYDADGLTAGYVMKKALLQVAKCSVVLHYPNRCEGYGLSMDFCKTVVAEHGDNANILILTVDNGITKRAEVDYLNEHGIECIITDHHMSQKEEIPNCLVVDPHNAEVNQNDTYKHLSGCSVAFKVAQLVQELHGMNDMYQYLPYVAISIITDVMPMHTENLAILQYGLDIINSKSCPLGIAEYKRQNNIDYMTTKDIGWTLGPMLNACGRMGDTELGSKLFFTDNEPIEDVVNKIKSINEKRKNETKRIVKQLDKKTCEHSVFIWNIDRITAGIIGIIAGKAAERFNLPSIIVTKNEDFYTENTILHGSARSAQGVNLVPLMEQLKAEGLIIEFGGHSEAIGIKFYHRDMDKVQARLDELVQFVDKDVESIFEEEEQTLLIDEILTLENLNVVILALSNILPTDGRQLREATFAITNCEVKSFKTYPSGYMEVTLKQGNKVLDMSAMGYAEKFSTEILPELDGKDKPLVHIAGSITKHFKSKKYVLNIVDIVVA